ncbi:MAG: hypothetical protein LBH90_08665 [Tannerella sp.]|jgi:hypothetical protein|nr:hypothetical protein [Tannerella sp.]
MIFQGNYPVIWIQSWLRKYGERNLLNKTIRVETMEERDELKRLREELKALKLAYANLAPAHKCSEKCIEVAGEMFNLDLKSTDRSYRHTQKRRTGDAPVCVFRDQPQRLLQGM